MDEARRKKPVKYRQPERSEMKRRLNRKIIIIMELSPLLHSKPPSISIRSLVATKKMDLINTYFVLDPWNIDKLVSVLVWCAQELRMLFLWNIQLFFLMFIVQLYTVLLLESCEAYYFMWNQHRIFCA